MCKKQIVMCFYCGKQLTPRKKTRDHIIPKSRNGSNKKYNIVDACRPCNQLKGSLDLQEFRAVMAYRHGLLPAIEWKFPGEKI
jgi:5-methylcytosine-specific restriction endonuclease McrA